MKLTCSIGGNVKDTDVGKCDIISSSSSTTSASQADAEYLAARASIVRCDVVTIVKKESCELWLEICCRVPFSTSIIPSMINILSRIEE